MDCEDKETWFESLQPIWQWCENRPHVQNEENNHTYYRFMGGLALIFVSLPKSSPTGLIGSKLKTKVHSFPVFSGKRTTIRISLPIHPWSRMNVSTCSWEVSKIKHVDTGVTNLLTSLVIVLISYMLCISDQNYIKAEKSGRMNNAHGYEHQCFIRKNRSISFIKHCNCFLSFSVYHTLH